MRYFKLIFILLAFNCESEGQPLLDHVNSMGQSNYNIMEQNNVVWIATNRTATMFQEGGIAAGEKPVTPVTADGQTVGLFYDLGQNALCGRANTVGAQPTLGSGGGRNSYFNFDGTNDRTGVNNTASLLKPFHAPAPKGSIYCWVNFTGGNAQTRVIMHTDNVGNANNGFYLIKNTSNKIVFGGTDGAAFYTCTSTTSVTSSTGWIGIIASVTGTGASGARLILLDASGATLEDNTFNVPTSRGSTANAAEGLWIGARSTLVANQFMFGSIGDIIIKPEEATSQTIDAFRTYNPARTAIEFSPILQNKWDFNDPATMFSDAGVTPVTNGDPIQVLVTSKATNYGPLERGATSSGTARPTYRTNIANGKGAAEFDGVNDNLTFQQTFFEEQCGKWTFFIVARNRDATFGSHFMSGAGTTSGDYIVETGNSYVNNAPFGQRLVIHPLPASDPSIAVPTFPTTNADATVQIFAVTRNGTALKGWNSNLVTGTTTTDNICTMLRMGQDAFGGDDDWWLDGYVFYVEKYNGLLKDNQVEARIQELKNEYGL